MMGLRFPYQGAGASFILAAIVGFSLALVLSSSSPSFGQEDVPMSQLSLEECIRISISSSPNAILAQEGVERARAAIGQARAGFFPRLSIRETYMRSDFGPIVFSNQLAQGNLSGTFPVPPPAGFDPFGQFNNPGALSNWNTQFLAQWSLYRGGETLNSSRAAGAQLDAAELALRTVHDNLALSVSQAYYEILKTENSILIGEESVRQIRKHLDMAEARFESEVALRSDVLRVAVRLAEAEEALEISRHNLERSKSQLNLAMGRDINDQLEPIPFAEIGAPDLEVSETLEELTDTAHKSRPEIEGMDKTIEALEYSVAVAKAGYYPRVDAFAHYDIDTEDFSGSNDSWTIGIGASISIFDGFLTRSSVQAARASLRESEARKKQLMLQIDAEVKNSYLARSEAARRTDVLHEAVTEAEESLRIIAERYSEGLTLVTELLDAEVALTNTRLRLLSAQYDYLEASAALDRSAGRIIKRGTEL